LVIVVDSISFQLPISQLPLSAGVVGARLIHGTKTGWGRENLTVLLLVLGVLLGQRQPERLADAPLGAAPPEVAATKVLHVGGVDGPVVALAVGGAARLHEAVVEREVVADGVAPAAAARVKVGVVVEDPLVDVAEDELLLGRGQNGERDQADVAVRGLWLLGFEARKHGWVVAI